MAVANNLQDPPLCLHNLLYRLFSRKTCLREPESQSLEALNNAFRVGGEFRRPC